MVIADDGTWTYALNPDCGCGADTDTFTVIAYDKWAHFTPLAGLVAGIRRLLSALGLPTPARRPLSPPSTSPRCRWSARPPPPAAAVVAAAVVGRPGRISAPMAARRAWQIRTALERISPGRTSAASHRSR